MQPDAEVILGNSLELCDIVVTHSGISRRHCGVRYDSLIGQYRGDRLYKSADQDVKWKDLADGQLYACQTGYNGLSSWR